MIWTIIGLVYKNKIWNPTVVFAVFPVRSINTSRTHCNGYPAYELKLPVLEKVLLENKALVKGS